MIDMERALGLLADEVHELEVTEIDLLAAQGHALAESVVSQSDFPAAERSAMDGYAVRAADTSEAGRMLEVVAEVRAGQPAAGVSVAAGQAVRIMTGAVVPPGADAVVMVERTETIGTRVTVREVVQHGQNVRRCGEELARGALVVEAGSPVHAPDIAALAALGRTRLRVFRRPTAHVLSTGDELVEPEQEPGEHQVRNSNARSLLAQLGELGIAGRYLGIAPDERRSLDSLLREGLSSDLLLVTGGVSVGTYDLVGEALAASGMRLLFHGVSIKPGKPVLAGRSGSCLVFGLPGNPVSSFTCFFLLVAPAIRRLMGFRRWQNIPVTARLRAPIRQRAGPRTTYHLARLEPHAGGIGAQAVRTSGSGDVFALSRANGFLITPAGSGDIAPGAELPALPWKDFHLR